MPSFLDPPGKMSTACPPPMLMPGYRLHHSMPYRLVLSLLPHAHSHMSVVEISLAIPWSVFSVFFLSAVYISIFTNQYKELASVKSWLWTPFLHIFINQTQANTWTRSTNNVIGYN